jgi:hypothetical protein
MNEYIPHEAEPSNRFIRLLKSSFRFRFFLFLRLPSAYFSGLRIREIDAEHCVISVPYKWYTKNPFRSTYFACLSMAAEMSTGALAMSHVYRHDPPISMLVIRLESTYFKKATGRTDFRCEDGAAMQSTIQQAVATGEAQTLRALSIGSNAAGEPVAEFSITWSFKVKSK